MGLEVVVKLDPSLQMSDVLTRLAARGIPCTLAMVDGNLVSPGTQAPPSWDELRLKTAAGTVTLSRREHGIAVIVFGNADQALRQAQIAVAGALGPGR